MTPESRDDEIEELLELATLLAAASCVWWIIAGAISLYWASGGTIGSGTLWGGREALSGARDPRIVSLLWTIGALELILAALASAVARGWVTSGFQRVVNTSAFLIGLTLVPYVAVDTLFEGLVVVDLVDPATLDGAALAWRLLFWNPWWVVGVLTYCAGAWLHQYAADQQITRDSRGG